MFEDDTITPPHIKIQMVKVTEIAFGHLSCFEKETVINISKLKHYETNYKTFHPKKESNQNSVKISVLINLGNFLSTYRNDQYRLKYI